MNHVQLPEKIHLVLMKFQSKIIACDKKLKIRQRACLKQLGIIVIHLIANYYLVHYYLGMFETSS
jgi:hypothetical protein